MLKNMLMRLTVSMFYFSFISSRATGLTVTGTIINAISSMRISKRKLEKLLYHTTNMSATTSMEMKKAYTTQYIIHFTYKHY